MQNTFTFATKKVIYILHQIRFFFFWNKTNTFKDFEVECCQQPSETVDQPPVLFLLSRLGLCVINPFENSLSTSKKVQPKAYCGLKMVPLPLNTENLVCVYLKIFWGGGWWNFLLWGLHQQGLWAQVMTVSSWPRVLWTKCCQSGEEIVRPAIVLNNAVWENESRRTKRKVLSVCCCCCCCWKSMLRTA